MSFLGQIGSFFKNLIGNVSRGVQLGQMKTNNFVNSFGKNANNYLNYGIENVNTFTNQLNQGISYGIKKVGQLNNVIEDYNKLEQHALINPEINGIATNIWSGLRGIFTNDQGFVQQKPFNDLNPIFNFSNFKNNQNQNQGFDINKRIKYN